MPNPKRKFTRSRRDSRRAQAWRMDQANLSPCPQCGALRASHRVCRCGFYNGKLVVAAKVKKKKGPEAEGGEAAQ